MKFLHDPAFRVTAKRSARALGGTVLVASMGLWCVRATARSAVPPDPFAFLRPGIAVSMDERQRLERGESVVRVLPSKDHEVGIFAAVATKASGDRMVRWMRRIEALKKTEFVRQIGRFSDPPRLDNVAGLSLEDDEVGELRKCRRGDCALKLAGTEIDEMRQVAREANAAWKPAIQATFRSLVLRRVEAFVRGGHGALPAYEDGDEPVRLADRFSTLIKHSVWIGQHPQFVEYLESFPRVSLPDLESFIYWSKEGYAGKPIISATQVNILRGVTGATPEVLVVGRELFSTHYVNASLSVTAIVASESRNYLVYLNRSEVDILGGFMGGVVRGFIERRLKGGASDVLKSLRTRMEGGEPPAASDDPQPGRQEGRKPGDRLN